MASRRAIGHWLILLLLSVLFSSLLLRIHLPAALLLGPLIARVVNRIASTSAQLLNSTPKTEGLIARAIMQPTMACAAR